jgi:glycerol-3-phosphate O-acyltransferase
MLSFLTMDEPTTAPTAPPEAMPPPTEPPGVEPAASSLRESITAPPPERTPHSGSMLERWGLLGRFLSRVFFSQVFFPVEAVETVRKAAATGIVVYVLRMRNTLEFLYFNYAFLAHGLPLARFANGVRLLLWLPLGLLLRRIFGKHVRRDGIDTLRRLTRARRSSALFLRTPPGLIPPAEFEGPYLRSLIELQRESERPIVLVPLTVIWGRPCVRDTEGASLGPSLTARVLEQPLRVWGGILGDQDEPRLFRRIWQVLRHARHSLALACRPLNLQEFLAGRTGESDAIVGELDRDLLERIEAERRVRIGPRRSHPVEIRRQILESAKVREAIARRASSASLPVSRVRRLAARTLKRMQAGMTARGLRRLSWIVRHFWKRIFTGFEVDEAGLARIKEAAKHGPLLFLPTHRSHIDYLVMSDLCLARDMVPPHIAAGLNLSFWPLGWLFRTSGAFFIKRRYQGDDLYATLLSSYVATLLKEGHSIEVFIEGTRTRTGQVLPPKYGLLSVVADLAARGEVPPVHAVPASIGYERVVELGSLTREAVGAAKQPESFGGVLKAASVLRSNYGYVNVQFGEPIEIGALLAARGHHGDETAPEVRRRAIKSLGYHSNAASGAATAVTSTSLTAAALLCPGTGGVQRGMLCEILDTIGGAARAGGARFVQGFWRGEHPLSEDGIDYAIELLGRDQAVSVVGKGQGAVYVVEKEARLRLEYYKNQMVQHVLEASLMAMVLRALNVEEGEAVTRESLLSASRFIAGLVRLHFVHRAGDQVETLIEGARQHLLRLGLIREDPEHRIRLLASGQRQLGQLAALLESAIEAHGACARSLLLLRAGPMLRRPLEQEIVEQLHRWYLTGELRRYESCRAASVKIAIDWLVDEGILLQQGEGTSLEVALARGHEGGKALEVLSDRIARLLPRRVPAA